MKRGISRTNSYLMREKNMKLRSLRWAVALWIMASVVAIPVKALANTGDCGQNLSSSIPPRSASALSGSQFARKIEGLSDDLREAAIRDQLVAGNIPGFLRRLTPVTLDSGSAQRGQARVVICVAPDYLAIGSDSDYFLAPMRLETALSIARRFGFLLPTRKMVDAVYAQSPVQLQPRPLPASDAMRSTAYYWQHNLMVGEQRAANGLPLGTLTAGDKKDLVLTSRLWRMQDRVAIYGWHLPTGRPIQPLSTVHGWRYADYSHGVRLIADIAYVDGAAQHILSFLSDDHFAALFSDDGPIPQAARLIDALDGRAPSTGL
ncbi:hypothetical protein [Nevskia soli]|uniref:hypothetical protein n=1 Tax=Nevskia soli TaxID=418856 RepID=UPI0006925CA8|nr:hypothetical protein [Nevskia soli]